MAVTKDTYVIYGHDDSALCTQRNNDFYHIDATLAGGKADFTITIKNGETTLEDFNLNADPTLGYWKFTITGYTPVADVDLFHNKSQTIIEAEVSDDTVKIVMPQEYTLVIAKV